MSAMNTQIFNKKDIGEIEEILIHEVNKKVNMALEKEKATDTDFMGINLEIYRKNYSLWERSKTSDSISDKRIYLNTNVVRENTGIIEEKDSRTKEGQVWHYARPVPTSLVYKINIRRQ